MIAIAINVLLISSGVPQIVKLVKTKSSEDISLWMYLMTFLAVILLLIKSVHAGDISLITGNSTSLFFLSINLILILRYRK